MEPLSPGGDSFWAQSEQSGYKESFRPLKAESPCSPQGNYSSASHPLSWSGFCHVKSCRLHLFESKHSVGTRPTSPTELCWEFSIPMSQVWELHLMFFTWDTEDSEEEGRSLVKSTLLRVYKVQSETQVVQKAQSLGKRNKCFFFCWPNFQIPP